MEDRKTPCITMSPRAESNSPVETTLWAGPWPAEPTSLYLEPLDALDLAAPEGSIFRRRFDRPGNSLVRERQALFRLPDDVPNEPLTYNTEMDAANPAEPPLPPSPTLLARLPDFAACSTIRCGDPERRGYHVEDLEEDAEEGEVGECHKCGGPGRLELVARMHRLPCGHLLCGACLSLVAITALTRAHSGDSLVRRPIREAAEELGRLRRGLVPGVGASLLRASQQARMLSYRRRLLDLLGLSCCNRDTYIVEDWILCLDEWVARSLWSTMWRLFHCEGQVSIMWCGWRDCRAVIPTWCSYLNERGSRRWYCVSCQGNSRYYYGLLAPAR